MGYNCDRVIVVNGFSAENMASARQCAADVFGKHGFHGVVSGLYQQPVNGNWTFIIIPDGSKEGWSESERGDLARGEFINWLIEMRRRPNRTMYLDWAEIVIHDDNGNPRVERHVNELEAV
jgi:hypothetical protein